MRAYNTANCMIPSGSTVRPTATVLKHFARLTVHTQHDVLRIILRARYQRALLVRPTTWQCRCHCTLINHILRFQGLLVQFCTLNCNISTGNTLQYASPLRHPADCIGSRQKRLTISVRSELGYGLTSCLLRTPVEYCTT